ncbi:MAG TPA: gliding motility protein GldG, partial [Planctomycetota bacterium]|nr:gliding motility protein GldG [Planctomycetota bacterium]
EADTPAEDPGNPMARFMAERDSNLEPLYKAWGVQQVEGKLVADRQAALKVRTGSAARPESLDYVLWLGLATANLDGQDAVTSAIQRMNVGSAGSLQKLDGAGTEFVPLLFTGKESMLVDATAVQFQPDPKKLLATFAPADTSYTIAARVRGVVKTAFPDGRPKAGTPPAPQDGEEPPPPADDGPDPAFVAESAEPINVILVADVDMLQDQWWVQVQNFFGQKLAMPTSGNGDFVSNALDNLSGSNDLISVRSRRGYERPFERIEALKRDAEQQFLAKEQELQDKLKSTEQRINELQSQKQDGSSLILSPEQRSEIERFRAEQLATRKELRDVQHDLRKGIDTLETRLKFINVGLVPLLLGVVAVALGSWRSRRRRD